MLPVILAFLDPDTGIDGQALKPLLFDDEHPTPQSDPVAKATRSASAKRKTTTKRAPDTGGTRRG